MATIQTGAPYLYYGGHGGASRVVGWESSQTRVARHQFKTTSIGASSVSWTFEKITFESGSTSGGLRWYIGESSTSHADAGMNSVYTGAVTISENTASGSANIVLKPNTTYYLWVFPASETYGWWWWVGDYATLEVVGSSSKLSLSPSSVEIGSVITATIDRASSSFTHTVEFYINNTYYEKFENIAESKEFTIPDSWYGYMSSSTECKAYCRITTYNGNAQIGDKVTKQFTVKVPSGNVPTIGTISLTPEAISGNNILVKDQNTLTIKVTGCAATDGSTIKSYTFSGPSISKTISSSAGEYSISIGTVSNIGTLTYKITVTDSRGRSASKTQTIECYDYYLPSIKNFKAYRANSKGESDEKGSYLKCLYTSEYASVNNTNSVTIKIFYSNGASVSESTSDLINIGSDTNTTYKVYATISDLYGGQSTSNTETIFGNTRIFNINKSGTGIAIGKMAESDNLFECRWPAKFDGDVECGAITSTSINTDELTVNEQTISSLIQTTIKNALLDSVYPVGSIYMSVNSTSPATFLGGTWTQLQNRFLLGAGSSYSAGNTGGETTHTLTQSELPKVTGTVVAGAGDSGETAGGYGAFRSASGVFTASGVRQYSRAKSGYEAAWPSGDTQYGQERITMSFGNGDAHNNMPPYLVVYMWKRTA